MEGFPGVGGGGGACGGRRLKTDGCRVLVDIEGGFVVCEDLKDGGGTRDCDGVADWDFEGGVGAEAPDRGCEDILVDFKAFSASDCIVTPRV